MQPDRDALEPLRHARRQVVVSVPVMMDNGHLRMFEGYRVIYDNSRGSSDDINSASPQAISSGSIVIHK